MIARGSPNNISAAASTMRVFPEPVGPRNSRLPTGRPGEFNPAQNTWYISTRDCTPSACPTILERNEVSKSRVSVLRMDGSSWCRTAALIFPSPSSPRPRVWKAIEVSMPCFFEIQHEECQPVTQTLGEERSCTFNNIRLTDLWELSHGLRHCFI